MKNRYCLYNFEQKTYSRNAPLTNRKKFFVK